MKNKSRNNNSSIKAGDLIITEEPFVCVLSSKEKGNRCDFCFEKGKVLKCSGCQFVHYCGRSCQRDAWNEHKWECNNLKRVSPKVIPDAARMLAKIINKLNRGDGHSYRAFYNNSSFRMWKDLMSHYTELKEDKKRMEHVTTLLAVLNDFIKDISLPNAVEFLGIYGRMVINSFTILDKDMNSIGTGVYLACSILDHSCKPNAVAVFDGKTISIRATQNMPCLDWNQLRISYINLMKTPYERQNELLKSYYFLCQCEKCTDEEQIQYAHAAKCPNASCDNPIQLKWKENCRLVMKNQSNNQNYRQDIQNGGRDIRNGDRDIHNGDIDIHNGERDIHNCDDIRNGDMDIQNGADDMIHCDKCGNKLSDKFIEKFKTTMEFTELHLIDMEAALVSYVDVCKFCLERQDGVVHPLNVMHAQTLDHAFDALIQVQLWDQAIKYAEELIPCFRFYYGEYHPLVGLLYLKYGKILLYKMETQKALENLKKSEKVLKITHGTKHELYKEDLIPLLQQAICESQ